MEKCETGGAVVKSLPAEIRKEKEKKKRKEKNLPANAGDMGSSPGLGRSHMLWSN